LVALSTEVLAAEGSLLMWWEQRFGESLLKTCTTLSSSKGKIRLFVDGLDRLANPLQIVDELSLVLREGVTRDALRVVLTATEAVSNQVFQQLNIKGLGELTNRWSIPPLSPEEARELFVRLNPEATEVQLGKEVEVLLTSPLLVHLARVLGGQESTIGITPGRLLRAHADTTVLVDPVRTHLSLKIVSHILERKSKSISLNLLLEDPSLRSVLLTSGKDSPLQQLIQDHVLLLDRAPTSQGLPLPSQAMISFAFDAQLDYLAFAQLASQFGVDSVTWQKQLQGRTVFGPLVGALRIFVVESLLERPSIEKLEDLADLLISLDDVGIEVLKDLLSVGLAVSPKGSLYQMLRVYIDKDGPNRLAMASEESLHRMVIAGRAQAVYELVSMLWVLSPTSAFVPQVRSVIHITAWAVGIDEAKELAHSLHKHTQKMSISEQVVGLDAMREVHILSGLASDMEVLEPIQLHLEDRMNRSADEKLSVEAQVLLIMIKARNHIIDSADKVPLSVAYKRREEYFQEAVALSIDRLDLMMKIKSERALLYLEHSLGKDLEYIQNECIEAVEFACSIGDPFSEALCCDLAAMAWQNDLASQLDWIERGLIASSSLNAKIARARLLDRRGRIYLSQGRLDDALMDATEASDIFKEVGHHRHALRTKQHLYALAMHESRDVGKAFAGWQELIPMADRLGVAFQSRLVRLLEASLLSNLGRVVEAEQRIDEVKASQSQQRSSSQNKKQVNTHLF
jgi:hypothetical protein